MPKYMRLEIVSAEGEVYSGEADMLVAPGTEGQLGILPSHAPLLTQLEPGEVAIHSGGESFSIALSGGFLEVLGDHVVILADAAERAEEIDIERAEVAMRGAQERIASRGADVDLERALQDLRRSQAWVRVARRRGGPPTGAP